MNVLQRQLSTLGRAWGRGIEYLLRDDFTTAQAPPLTSPRTGEPGPGIWTVVDTANKLSISGGVLRAVLGTPNAPGDPRLFTGAYTRKAGLTFLHTFRTDSSLAEQVTAGFHENTEAKNRVVQGWLNYSGNLFGPTVNNILFLLPMTSGAKHEFLTVLRNSGAFYFVRGGSYTDWTLIWVDNSITTSSLHGMIGYRNETNEVDRAAIFDLGEIDARFRTDNGFGTVYSETAAGNLFYHAPDFRLEFSMDELPQTSNRRFIFRKQDDNNHLFLNVGANGSMFISKVVDGASTGLGGNISTQVVFPGSRVFLAADGPTIRVYSDNVLRFTVTESTFSTQADGQFHPNYASGVVANFIVWPSTVTLPEI